MDANVDYQTAKDAWEYWYPLVFGYFYKRVNSRVDVEELTSNTVSALLLKQDVQNPKAFVWQTARNQLVEFIKNKEKKPTPISLDKVYETNDTLVDEISYQKHQDDQKETVTLGSNFLQKKEKLRDCIQQVSNQEELQILTLCIIEDKNSTEVGEILAIKSSTIRQKLKRAIAKLKEKCIQVWDEDF